jgi:hypothetical protein
MTELSSQHWAKAHGISRKEDIPQLKKKKGCGRALRSA